jgi:hypothetical protein
MTDDSRDQKQPKKDQQPKRKQSGDRGNGKGLDPEAQKHIGRMLKATYEQIAHEPVPDKFLQLLKQLESSEPRK